MRCAVLAVLAIEIRSLKAVCCVWLLLLWVSGQRSLGALPSASHVALLDRLYHRLSLSHTTHHVPTYLVPMRLAPCCDLSDVVVSLRDAEATQWRT
jgi:hypothetical protein